MDKVKHVIQIGKVFAFFIIFLNLCHYITIPKSLTIIHFYPIQKYRLFSSENVNKIGIVLKINEIRKKICTNFTDVSSRSLRKFITIIYIIIFFLLQMSGGHKRAMFCKKKIFALLQSEPKSFMTNKISTIELHMNRRLHSI